jgi:hypothetical protein
MWRFVLFAVFAYCAYCQSTDCAANSTKETRPVGGPHGASAVLRIYSHDDHVKGTHECLAEYHMRTTPQGPPQIPTGFYASDGDWVRRLIAHLDGFSQDGEHIFGIIAEGGAYSFAMVFDFRVATGNADMVEIREAEGALRAAKCGTSFTVAGATTDGRIILEPNTAEACRARHRWLLDRSGTLRDMPLDTPFQRLYPPTH